MNKENGARSKKVALWNIANILTILRLILVPVFVVAFLVDDPVQRWWATGIFAVAALTDKLDGHFARAWDLITDFGKLADSIADKALIIAALLLLSWHGYLWWWVTLAFIVRELGITLLRMRMRKVQVMAAGWHGKVKMAAQSFGIGALLLPWETFLPHQVANFLLYAGYFLIAIALFYAVISAYEYIRQALRLQQKNENKEK